MSYRLICDSCTDPTPDLRGDPHFTMVPLSIHVGAETMPDDGELRQAVSPLERALELMRMLYPVVLALSLLSAAGVAVLFVMLLAKEAAILRVQGTAKIQTILMLSLQQVFTCFSGLTIGLTGILLYIGGTRPDLLPGIAPGTAVCAAAYLAAGVLGAIAGILGSIQAAETLKYLTGTGELLTDRLLTFDARTMEFHRIESCRQNDCPLCGIHPMIEELVSYGQPVCDLKPHRNP